MRVCTAALPVVALVVLGMASGANAESEPPNDGAAPAMAAAEAGADSVWGGHFQVAVPTGWTHAATETSASTGASPRGVKSQITVMTSPSGTHVAVAAVDGQALALGMAAPTQRALAEAYLDIFFLSLGAPVDEYEPWSCGLSVPRLSTPHGARVIATELDLGGDVADRGARTKLPPGPFWSCTARDVGRGALVVAVGWAGEGSTLDEAGTIAEIREAMAGVGFTAVASPDASKRSPTSVGGGSAQGSAGSAGSTSQNADDGGAVEPGE